MNKKLLCLILCLVGSTLHAAKNADNQKTDSINWGFGVILGEPIALSAKYKISHESAVDFGLGYYWSHSVNIFSDYLYLFPGTSLANETKLNFVPYIGIGGLISLGSHEDVLHSGLYARMPLGLSLFIPQKSAIEFFVELVPILALLPGLSLALNGGIGLRVYF